MQNGRNTRYSQPVTHASTNRAQRCLTSVIRREPVFPTWYGRARHQSCTSPTSTHTRLSIIHTFMTVTVLGFSIILTNTVCILSIHTYHPLRQAVQKNPLLLHQLVDGCSPFHVVVLQIAAYFVSFLVHQPLNSNCAVSQQLHGNQSDQTNGTEATLHLMCENETPVGSCSSTPREMAK